MTSQIQNYRKNTRFEILTPDGTWDDFDGVIENDGDRAALIIHAEGKTITSTEDHRFFKNGEEVSASSLRVGDFIDGKDGKQIQITDIENTVMNRTYDVFNSETHKILCCDLFSSHQCDEFSFIPNNIQEQFWAANLPVLSTGGSCIITSTPKTDVDQFADIYFGALDTKDDFGNENPTGIGKNGFYALTYTWESHPDRDKAWAEEFRKKMGEKKFRQEMECCVHNTTINLLQNTRKFDMQIGELFHKMRSGKPLI